MKKQAEMIALEKDENPEDGVIVQNDDANQETSKGEYNDIEHLSIKEQKHPVAWKWVYTELKRLKRIELEYVGLKDNYASLDKEYEVFKVSSKQSIQVDVISSVLLALGPALLGLIPSVGNHNDDSFMKLFFGIFGGMFIISAILLKVYSYKKL